LAKAKKKPKKTTRKKASATTKRFGFRELFLLCIGLSLPFCVYVVYLNHQVTQQFEGKRFALPAKVFARPLELYRGNTLSVAQLEKELSLLNYRAVSQVNQPGQYARSGTTFTIYARPFTFWDGVQEARIFYLSFSSGKIARITDANSGEDIALARLDPITIGGIYPNKGEDRELIRLNQAPDILIDTLVAIEDKRYYQHKGIDPKAIMRAITTLFGSERIQGGSTITQQLVKNFFLTQERTIKRKLKEMVMAILLELHYSKEEILETYLNEVYFGQDKNRAIHGIGLASQFYFSQSIEHLTLPQSALLVGLLKGPAYYNPRRHPKRAKKRRDLILKTLLTQNIISRQQFTQATNTKLDISRLPETGQTLYPAFIDLVVRQLSRDYKDSDLRSEGLRIFSTLDPLQQEIVERNLSSQLKTLEKSHNIEKKLLEAAAVVVNTADGEVQALVGSRNVRFPGFNRALDASRQIGSLIKPAIYLTALDDPEQFNLTTLLDDSPFVWQEPGIEDWAPQNYDKKFHGDVPLWLALAKSYNVSAARLGTDIGLANIMATTRKLGIEKEMPAYASNLLGTMHLTPYEVTQMYHTIASGGFRTPFRAIRAVTTQHGEPLNRYNLRISQTISATPNYLLTHALQKVVTSGTGHSLNRILTRKLDAAGKTGTTDNLRDSWFAGFTGDKVAVVWVGNDDNKSIGLTGASGALPIWGKVMNELSHQALQLPTPEDVRMVAVSKTSGELAVRDCSNTFNLPFAEASLPADGKFCSGKTSNKIKSWFKNLFGKNK